MTKHEEPLTFVSCQSLRVNGISFAIKSIVSTEKFLCLQKWPRPITEKILSMEEFEGRVQLKIAKCRFRRCGMSFRPPPGWIIAAKN